MNSSKTPSNVEQNEQEMLHKRAQHGRQIRMIKGLGDRAVHRQATVEIDAMPLARELKRLLPGPATIREQASTSLMSQNRAKPC